MSYFPVDMDLDSSDWTTSSTSSEEEPWEIADLHTFSRCVQLGYEFSDILYQIRIDLKHIKDSMFPANLEICSSPERDTTASFMKWLLLRKFLRSKTDFWCSICDEPCLKNVLLILNILEETTFKWEKKVFTCTFGKSDSEVKCLLRKQHDLWSCLEENMDPNQPEQVPYTPPPPVGSPPPEPSSNGEDTVQSKEEASKALLARLTAEKLAWAATGAVPRRYGPSDVPPPLPDDPVNEAVFNPIIPVDSAKTVDAAAGPSDTNIAGSSSGSAVAAPKPPTYQRIKKVQQYMRELSPIKMNNENYKNILVKNIKELETKLRRYIKYSYDLYDIHKGFPIPHHRK